MVEVIEPASWHGIRIFDYESHALAVVAPDLYSMRSLDVSEKVSEFSKIALKKGYGSAVRKKRYL